MKNDEIQRLLIADMILTRNRPLVTPTSPREVLHCAFFYLPNATEEGAC